jgi:hypothetical protein
MDYIGRLQDVIRRLHGCESEHVSTVPVTEMFNSQIVWQGDVEVFTVRSHPQAQRCYAWAYQGDDSKEHYTAVLELPPVKSAQDAVKAAIVAGFKNEKT